MSRGGSRLGSGSKPKWKHGRTKPVRVPEALADRLLEIAKILDTAETDEVIVEIVQVDEQSSKVVDLTGIAVHAFPRGPGVYLTDLVRHGYTIKPERLARNIKVAESNAERELRNLLDSGN